MGGVQLQLFPEPADVHVHGAGIALVFIAPDQIQQSLPAVDPAGIFHQEEDQVELLHGQFHRNPVLPGGAPLLVHGDVPPLQRGGGALGPRGGEAGSAQQGPDPGLQHHDVEGLGHVIVGPGLKAHEHIRLFAAGGEHDDGHGGKAADLLAGLQPVLFGHHQVQDDQVIAAGPGHGNGHFPVIAHIHGVALILQIEFDALHQELFVVNDQNFHISPPSFLSCNSSAQSL